MSKDINYRCDLCRETKPISEVVGIVWQGKTVQPKLPRDAESHLCRNCLYSLDSQMSLIRNFMNPKP